MLRVGFARVRPEKEQRLRAWLAELSRRLDEVLESFARETTRHEQVFIVLGQDGPLLVYVIEAGDIEHASDAYKNSPLAIDKEHRAVLEECLLERLRVDPLFECAVQAFRKDAA